MKEVNSSKKLFAEFPKISKEKWKEKVLSDLKGADFDQKLVWKTVEGFKLYPYYSGEDLRELGYLKKFENSLLDLDDGSQGTGCWVNREKIVVDDIDSANKNAINALNSGADGIIFDWAGKEDIELGRLLNNILPLHPNISFDVKHNAAKLIKEYFTFTSQKQIETNLLSGSINLDPIRSLTRTGKMAGDGFNVVKKIIDITDDAPRFYGLVVNGTEFRNSGSDLVQELAFSLNVAVDYLDNLGKLGLSAEKVIRNLEFSMAIGTDYFLEIAKLKALRILFYKIAASYGWADYNPGSLSIHSISTRWTKTIYDPYVNMLRNTTEAMSAILGGCHALTILPYNEYFEQPSTFSTRISRNVSNILKEESYFDKVVDPSAGSYYIENITNEFVRKAWELFKEVELEGGFIKSFKAGNIQARIKETRHKRLKSAALRKEIFVGSNQYPNTKEQLDPMKIRRESDLSAETEILTPGNGVMEFESLRLATDTFAKQKGRRPKAYLALIGNNPAMRTARAQFSNGFIGCGGFEIIDGDISQSNDEAVQKALEQNAEITVICGSDTDYASSGIDFARKFRKDNKDGLLVLAGYPSEILEDLREAGVDEFIHLRSDLIQSLASFQQKLNII